MTFPKWIGPGMALAFLTVGGRAADIVINEIHFHPPHAFTTREPVEEEFVELRNNGTNAVNLYGWQFDRGVTFAFTNVNTNFSLGPNGYVVIAANRAALLARFPGTTNAIGGWLGTLSNNGEEVRLIDAAGDEVDRVSYATEGDWATRQRGPLDRNHRGWVWSAPADGLGASVQVRNPRFQYASGQNWTAAPPTPGTVNIGFTNNAPPLILDVAHSPVIPRSTQTVAVTALILNENPATITATLYHRLDAASPGTFTAVPMLDNGGNGDGIAGDGIYGAILPARTNDAIVEFYLEAADAGGALRTWPALPLPAADETELPERLPYGLYQVDDTTYAGTLPLFKLTMTGAEAEELRGIPPSNDRNSNAEMNGTFLEFDGAQTHVRYLCGFRNRGHGSRGTTPPNYRVNYPNDQRIEGAQRINLNAVNPHVQVLGAVLAHKAGVAGADARAVAVRINNENRMSAGIGFYAANEVLDSAWAQEHFPDDEDGNIYRAIRDIAPQEMRWRGTNVTAYTNTYFKENSLSAYDWSDLIQMHRILGTNDQFTTENVRQVIDVGQWMRHVALMAVFANAETGINTGYNDDYFMYRGVTDPRFRLLYYDLDSLLGIASLSNTSTIYGCTQSPPANANPPGVNLVMSRLLNHPDFAGMYTAALQDLLDTTFSEAAFEATVDQVWGGLVGTTTIGNVKTWMDTRRAYVQAQITGLVPPKTNHPLAVIIGEPRSPTPFSAATLFVRGNDITHYRYRLNQGASSAERSVATPITLSNLAHGSTNTVFVVGKNSGGIFQPTNSPTVSQTWAVRTNTPAVRLNEVLARNTAAVDHAGTFPDVIELFNDGPVTVNLAGLRLTDQKADPDKFAFPSGTMLATGAYLVVYADSANTPGLHTGFSLQGEGDQVFLFDKPAAGGALLDVVEFGAQVPDLSLGRVTGGTWQLTVPTFGATNSPQPLGDLRAVRINEWLATSAPLVGEDFIELFNPGALPVDLGGCYLSDEPVGAPAQHRIPPLSFIARAGWTAFIADGNAGPDHLGFQLSSRLGEISLKAPDLTAVDCVSYGPQREGEAEGRCADGAWSFSFLVPPTPGGRNPCPATLPPVLVNLVPLTNEWRYHAGGVDLGTAWRGTNYNDAAWNTGRALLGHLRTNPAAMVPDVIRTDLEPGTNKPTFYFRTRFLAPAGLPLAALQISNVVDDGAVFYFNGTEVGRFNLPAGPVNFTNLTGPGAAIIDAAWRGPISVSLSLLRPGTNVLAVEVHQATLASSDVMFGLRLDGVAVTNTAAEAGVVLNEILADNATVADADGATKDWVELYNPSAGAVDFGDLSLSDSTGNPRRWVFPSPTILPAGGFLVVRFDPDAPASPTNTGFGLKATGDAVYLFNRPSEGGGMLDGRSFGLQVADFSIGRIPAGGANWRLGLPTPGAANLAITLGNVAQLRINEWLAANSMGDDWFELYNPNAQPVALAGLWLSDDLTSALTRQKHPLPPLSFIGSLTNAYWRFWADRNLGAGADHVDFRLSADLGDAVGISQADGTLINGVNFGVQTADVSSGRLPDGSTSIVRFPQSLSPGQVNYLPLTNVVINEVLSHSDAPLEDAIELRNLTGAPVDISGWFLSDARGQLRKFVVPPSTSLLPFGFKVFYEYQFNSPDFPATAFALSSGRGDEVFLSQATGGGGLTGYRSDMEFGPGANGVSFGRYVTSDARVDFPALAALTFGTTVTATNPPGDLGLFRTGAGATNAYPKVGPVVLGEIMYHPPDIIAGGVTNDNGVEEFIELRNLGPTSVPLYDPAFPANGWRLRDAVDFRFDARHTLAAGGHLIVVSFDPATDVAARSAFYARYGSNFALAGPFTGRLDNNHESVELVRPDAPQPDGSVPFVLVEKVVYYDRTPWPTNADGRGQSLQRRSATGYPNDPTNWIAAAPAPGPSGVPDTDLDGMPDAWEMLYNLNKNSAADAAQDADQDGLTNLEEFIAGTHPRDNRSYLRLTSPGVNGGAPLLQFPAVTGKTYTILWRDHVTDSAWEKLIDIGASPSDQIVTVLDPSAIGEEERYYRLVTPALP